MSWQHSLCYQLIMTCNVSRHTVLPVSRRHIVELATRRVLSKVMSILRHALKKIILWRDFLSATCGSFHVLLSSLSMSHHVEDFSGDIYMLLFYNVLIGFVSFVHLYVECHLPIFRCNPRNRYIESQWLCDRCHAIWIDVVPFCHRNGRIWDP